MSCGVGRRCSLDPALLWLWPRFGGYSSDWIPSLGTSTCRGSGPRNGKKTEKKKKKERKKKQGQLSEDINCRKVIQFTFLPIILLPIHPSTHCSCTHPSIHPPTHLPTHPSTHPVIHLCTHPPGHPSTHLPSTYTYIHPFSIHYNNYKLGYLVPSWVLPTLAGY